MTARPIAWERPSGRFRLASATTAWALGAVAAVLVLVTVSLTIAMRDPWPTNDGLIVVLMASVATVGVVVARKQPHNAIGWILIALALVVLVDSLDRLYLVLDFRRHQGSLPLGALAVFWGSSLTIVPQLLAFPAILLFPEGRVPTRRWRWLLPIYVVLAAAFTLAQIVGGLSVMSSSHPDVGLRGRPQLDAHGIADDLWFLVPVFLVYWLSFVGAQAAAWRRATGDRREQIKWLLAAGVVCVVSGVGIVMVGDSGSVIARVIEDIFTVGIAALPVAIGIGILKYRLYEIDRLISRTLSYAILTGFLVGVFVGFVALTTEVLPFSSPVGVAASTLVAAALFNPLRLRIQRLVDRRFNRARYDAEATVAAFAGRLRYALELETIELELLEAINRAVVPESASIWLRR